MNELAALDDARKVRTTMWCALAMGPLTLLFGGAGLILSYATIHANGGDVSKTTTGANNFPFYALWGIYFSLAAATDSRATFLRLTGWFVAGVVLANLTSFGLLTTTGFSTVPAQSGAAASLALAPFVVLIAYVFSRHKRKPAA